MLENEFGTDTNFILKDSRGSVITEGHNVFALRLYSVLSDGLSGQQGTGSYGGSNLYIMFGTGVPSAPPGASSCMLGAQLSSDYTVVSTSDPSGSINLFFEIPDVDETLDGQTLTEVGIYYGNGCVAAATFSAVNKTPGVGLNLTWQFVLN